MSSVPQFPYRVLADTSCEHLELRDVGAPAAAFVRELDEAFHYGEPADELTEREIDELAERHAARPAGFVDGCCLGCGCLLFVPATERCGDVLCTSCHRAGSDDDDTDPPPAAAVHPHFAFCVDQCAKWGDQDLITGVMLADEGSAAWGDDGQREAWLAAATAELLRRMDRRAA